MFAATMEKLMITRLAALTLTLALCTSTQTFAAAGEPTQQSNAANSPINWTPIIIEPATVPCKVQGSDHRFNLVYNLVLQNLHSNPSKIIELCVYDADHPEKPILILKEASLQNVFSTVSQKKDNSLAACQSGYVWINLSFHKSDEVPTRLFHSIKLDSLSPDKEPATYSYKTEAFAVDKREPVVISPPLRGKHWCVGGGYSGKLGHRRAMFPIDNHLFAAQTYAIDWEQLNDENLSCTGDPKKDESYPGYGNAVYAVADGTVYGTKEGFKNQVPGTAVGKERISYPGGNSITIDIGNGLYAFYAHLKPGSIKVKQGEQVKRGQVIAELGNSGNSSDPHLHMHITTGPSPLASAAFPYVFDKFEVEGEIEDIEAFDKSFSEQKPHKIINSAVNGAHHKELPKEGYVLSF
jgi:hypothetical protein